MIINNGKENSGLSTNDFVWLLVFLMKLLNYKYHYQKITVLVYTYNRIEN